MNRTIILTITMLTALSMPVYAQTTSITLPTGDDTSAFEVRANDCTPAGKAALPEEISLIEPRRKLNRTYFVT